MSIKRYSFDFETTTNPDDCRVWAWGAVAIDDLEDIHTGNNIDSFIDFIRKNPCKGTFHNLKFDGEFIICWLLQHGYKLNKTDKNMGVNSFNTLITDKGAFYKIVIKFENHSVTMTDSYKLLPFSVEDIAKNFKLPISKLSIDYDAEREIGHELTEDEVEYLLHDIKIVAIALKILYDQGMSKLTIGSNAISYYKKLDPNRFKDMFPQVRDDKFIRKSYKGGFTYCNPKYAGKIVGEGIVLDVNSLYPSVMENPNNLYPVGTPQYYKGKYVSNETYPLFVQRIIATFKVKSDHLPTIQIKGGFSRFSPTEYITNSGDEPVELTLTCVDLKLFTEQYDITDIEYIDGYMFKAETGLFYDYVHKWVDVKVTAEKEGNHAMRTIAKLMLNNLYGKFATNPKGAKKWPTLENGRVKYEVGEPEEIQTIYIPVGTFVTAYARDVTIRAAQSLYNRFLYADTDSLHLIGTDIPETLKVHPTDLGAWKHETTFTQAKFIRAKTYMECEYGEHWKITCAGMPKNLHEQVTIDNFNLGSEYEGKLMPKHVTNGIVLTPTTFKIRVDKNAKE